MRLFVYCFAQGIFGLATLKFSGVGYPKSYIVVIGLSISFALGYWLRDGEKNGK